MSGALTRFDVRPLRRHVLVLDDPDTVDSNGILLSRGFRGVHLDFTVVKVGIDEDAGFGQGDRVMLSDPCAGRPLKLDGTPYRLVRISDIIAVIEPDCKNETETDTSP